MDVSGFIVLVVGAAVLGLIGQFLFSGARFSYEWLVTGIGALVGGFVASEVINPTNWADAGGLLLVPALVGGLVVGAIVWLAARNVVSAPASRAS